MFAQQGSEEMERAFALDDNELSAMAFAEAIGHFESAIALSPSSMFHHDIALAHYCLSKRIDDQGDSEKHIQASIKNLKCVLEEVGFDFGTQDLLSRAVFALSEISEPSQKVPLLDEAIELMRPVVDQAAELQEFDSQELASYYHRFGLFNVNRGLISVGAERYQFFSPAVQYFCRAYQLDIENMHYWYCYGNSLMDKGKSTDDADERKELFEQSLGFHRKAIARLDDEKDVYGAEGSGKWIASEFKYNFACVLCLQGHHDESLAVLTEAINLYGYNKEFAGRDIDFTAISTMPEFVRLTGE